MAMLHVERQRFTVDDYHRMAEVGILSPDDRVELIDGEIIRMTPIGSRHAACVGRLANMLPLRLAGAAQVFIQSPVQLDVRYEPQPDVLVLRPRDDFYAERLPTAADVLFVMEVSDTSLALDREKKLPAYGWSGVPEAWIVDLAGERIERHSEPFIGGFRFMTWARRGESLPSSVLPDLVIEVDAVLGAPGLCEREPSS